MNELTPRFALDAQVGGGNLQGAWVIDTILCSTDQVLMDLRSRSRQSVVLAWVVAAVVVVCFARI